MNHVAQVELLLLHKSTKLGPAILREDNTDEEVAVVGKEQGECLVDFKTYLAVFVLQREHFGQLVVHSFALSAV